LETVFIVSLYLAELVLATPKWLDGSVGSAVNRDKILREVFDVKGKVIFDFVPVPLKVVKLSNIIS
jgi:hypothetical protein